MLIGFDVPISRNTQRSHETHAEPPCTFPDPQRWQWHLLAATAWTETFWPDQAALETWILHKCAGCFRAFFFFLIFTQNYPKRLENGNIDILIQHSLTSILQPIQYIGIEDALFESLLNSPLSDWAHSLPLPLASEAEIPVSWGQPLGIKLLLYGCSAHRALFLCFHLRFQIITGRSFITKVFCRLFHNSTRWIFDISMDAQVGLSKGV